MSASAIITGKTTENRWPNSTSQEGINTPLSANFESISVDRYLNCKTSEARVVPLAAVVEEIRNPMTEVQTLIREIRSCYKSHGGGKAGKKAIGELKSQLPAFTLNATGSRLEANVSNGIVVIDLDELGQRLSWARDNLKADPHCLFVFTSPSGDGLKALIKVPKAIGDEHQMRQQHRRNFLAVREYLRTSFALEIDPAASDILRLCYLSHDPDCELVYSARELEVEKYLPADRSDPYEKSDDPDAHEGADSPDIVNRSVVEALLDSIPPRPDYEIWIKLSAAVRNSLGDTDVAVSILKNWSPEEQKGEYANLLRASTFNRIGFGTLHYHARQNSFRGVVAKCFYTGGRGYFFDNGDKLLPLKESDLRIHLAPFRIPKGEMNNFLCRVRSENLVDHVLEIAGHSRGMHRFQEKQFLVKGGPSIIPAIRGGTGFIDSFVQRLLGDAEQYGVFMSWLQLARRCVVTGQRGQIAGLAIAGGAGDGKSLLIEIVRQSLGGRSADAHKYLSGQSRFNANLAGAELLYLDDSAASKDQTTTSRFAQALKSQLFSSSVSIEGKGVDAIELAPIQALIMAVNSEPQHLRVLPELDESMRDKLILLKSSPSPLPDGIAGDRQKVQAKLAQDLPGWLHLVEGFESKPWTDSRTGRLVCVQNSELLQMLRSVSPEEELLELLCRSSFCICKGWTGTAAAVEEKLLNDPTTAHRAKRLLYWNGACGTHLSKLTQRGGDLVTKGDLTKGTRIQQYVLNIPREESEEPEEPDSQFYGKKEDETGFDAHNMG
jgi:hypothetical protein